MDNVLYYNLVTPFLRKNLFKKKETAPLLHQLRAMSFHQNPTTFIAKM